MTQPTEPDRSATPESSAQPDRTPQQELPPVPELPPDVIHGIRAAASTWVQRADEYRRYADFAVRWSVEADRYAEQLNAIADREEQRQTAETREQPAVTPETNIPPNFAPDVPPSVTPVAADGFPHEPAGSRPW